MGVLVVRVNDELLLVLHGCSHFIAVRDERQIIFHGSFLNLRTL